MKTLQRLLHYFTTFEKTLYCVSVVVIVVSFFLSGTNNYMTVTASLIGATALTFLSKGNVIGQILVVVFSVFYGLISISYAYYGEMLTYLGMSAPIAIASIITWLKNPSKHSKAEVKINVIRKKEIFFMALLSIAVTIAFYFVLRHFNNANLIVSTISITTSFVAAYLSMRRSAYYALAYAVNDVILIILWIMASIDNITYLSMVVCFLVFLCNDIYGFVNWSKMKKRQNALTSIES